MEYFTQKKTVSDLARLGPALHENIASTFKLKQCPATVVFIRAILITGCEHCHLDNVVRAIKKSSVCIK